MFTEQHYIFDFLHSVNVRFVNTAMLSAVQNILELEDFDRTYMDLYIMYDKHIKHVKDLKDLNTLQQAQRYKIYG